MRVEKTADFSRWLDKLKDKAGRARILMRVDRLIHGNPGAHRNLTEGVSELKIDFGPGYRVYYSMRGDRLLLLLIGGNTTEVSIHLTSKTSVMAAFQAISVRLRHKCVK